jgi:hypothetical protein
VTIHGFGATPYYGLNTSLQCPHCARPYFGGGPDPCLGVVDHAVLACCGHGRPAEAYVTLVEGDWQYGRSPSDYPDDAKRTLTGVEALRFFRERGVGPRFSGSTITNVPLTPAERELVVRALEAICAAEGGNVKLASDLLTRLLKNTDA